VDDGSIQDSLGNPLQPGGPATFQLQQTFAASSSPVSIATADVNGDGRLDLMVAGYGINAVSVLLGNGDGTFQAPANLHDRHRSGLRCGR